MVGDKTIAFWLMDSAMYDGMSALNEAPPAVERGIALHKVGALATARALASGGSLRLPHKVAGSKGDHCHVKELLLWRTTRCLGFIRSRL